MTWGTYNGRADMTVTTPVELLTMISGSALILGNAKWWTGILRIEKIEKIKAMSTPQCLILLRSQR